MNRKYLLYLFLALPAWPVSTMADALKTAFNDAERRMIERYYEEQGTPVTNAAPDYDQVDTNEPSARRGGGKKGKKKNLPPGLAKRDQLPPGLARLQKNGKMPPGLARRDLPVELEEQLPPAPEGYERQVIEDVGVVLVHTATDIIADILYHAVTKH